jgi:hypothetical protein
MIKANARLFKLEGLLKIIIIIILSFKIIMELRAQAKKIIK